MPQTERVITVLVVSPFEQDHTVLRSILGGSEWNVVSAADCLEAWITLHESEIDVVVTECQFRGGLSWKDLLDEVEAMQGGHPVIVISTFADERLWAEVLNLGGYDLLMKPFDPAEVVRVLKMAGRVWQSDGRAVRAARNRGRLLSSGRCRSAATGR